MCFLRRSKRIRTGVTDLQIPRARVDQIIVFFHIAQGNVEIIRVLLSSSELHNQLEAEVVRQERKTAKAEWILFIKRNRS